MKQKTKKPRRKPREFWLCIHHGVVWSGHACLYNPKEKPFLVREVLPPQRKKAR